MTGGAALPTPQPTVNPETRAFWAAAAEHRLAVPVCRSCQEAYWYPRVKCPRCHSMDTTSVDASGDGAIYSYTVVRRCSGEYSAATPYVLALVELAEGPRILTNVVDWEDGELTIGAPVRLTFHDTAGGTALPRFRLVRE
ncbi:MAG TPA: OB-fold domain-containing protein [Pseudonocardia sp.]